METKDYWRARLEGTKWQYRIEWPTDDSAEYWNRESGPWRKTEAEAIADAMIILGWVEIHRGRWEYMSFFDEAYGVVHDADWVVDETYYWEKSDLPAEQLD